MRSVSHVPRISVVIPAYNSELYITSALRSALDSGEPDLEVIVVNDGSTDQTVSAVRAVDDPRVSLTSIAPSGGPSRPRNVGIALARAPYVSLLDSDDLLKPGKLTASVVALDHCPSAGFAFGNFEKIDEDGNVFETSFSHAYPVFCAIKSEPVEDGWQLISQMSLAKALLYENFISTSGVVVRKDLVTKLGGFEETIGFGEDLDLWFRLAHCCDALYTDTVGHAYRVHSAGVVRGSPPIRNAISGIAALRREKARWHERSARRQLDRRIAEMVAAIGRQQRLQGRRWSAMYSYLQAYATSPESRWLTNLIATALLTPESESWRRE
jgi:glycosyltransferase involved in cell wall biosynthesis